MELVDCKMGGAQLEILNYHVKYDEIPENTVKGIENNNTFLEKPFS